MHTHKSPSNTAVMNYSDYTLICKNSVHLPSFVILFSAIKLFVTRDVLIGRYRIDVYHTKAENGECIQRLDSPSSVA